MTVFGQLGDAAAGAGAPAVMRLIECFGLSDDNGVGTVANRVMIWAIVVPHQVEVDRIGLIHGLTAAGNWRAGIYEDNGDTPVGGALLCESASTPPNGINRCQEITVPDTVIPAGLYWIALAGSAANDWVYHVLPNLPTGCTIVDHNYNLGAWIALTDPCPATAQIGSAPSAFLRCKI